MAVGDISLARRVYDAMKVKGMDYPFDKVRDILKQGDVVFGNLESPICDTGKPISKTKEVIFRSPVETASSLKNAGFNLLSLANNHSLDFRSPCLIQSMDLLAQLQINTIGVFPKTQRIQSPVILTIHGIKIAFLGFSAVSPEEFYSKDNEVFVAPSYLPDVREGVREAKSKSDLVVVSFHWGQEYQEAPTSYQVKIGHAAIDAGADIILGQHPHILQGIEHYKKGWIFYSLGNFVFDLQNEKTWDSVILKIDLAKNGMRKYELLPVMLADGQPHLVQGEDARRILNAIPLISTENMVFPKQNEGKKTGSGKN